MKNRFLKTVLAASCLFLSGCMKVRIQLDVDSEGKVSSTETVLLRSEMLGMGGDIDASLEQMRQSSAENHPEAEVTIVKEEGTGEEDSYGGIAVRETDVQKYNVTVEHNTITLRIPRNSLQDEFSSEVGAEPSEEYDSADLKELGFEAVMIVNMPAAAKTNVGTVEGKTVTIDLIEMPSDIEEIVITSATGKLNPLLMGIAIAAAICLLVFAMRKRNDKKETA